MRMKKPKQRTLQQQIRGWAKKFKLFFSKVGSAEAKNHCLA